MKRIATLLVGGAALALGGCWTSGDDKSAEQVEQTAENTASELDAAADNASGAEEDRLETTADVIRDTGEAAAESVDDNDLVLNQGSAQ